MKREVGWRTFALVDADEQDVEVFERIPWESLEKPQDRRWVFYLVAAAVVMGAVGVTVGRGMSTPPSVPVPTEATVSAPTSSSGPVPSTIPVAAAPDIPTTWSEADLMAVPGETLEDAAAALAEWYVVDYFTRSGADAEGRSFVEWSAVVAKHWRSASALELTVVLRRLAARGDEPYTKVPAEGWLVTAELVDQGWVVVEGPVAVTPLEPVVDMAPLDGEVPAEVAAEVEEGEVRGGSQVAGGWLVELDWVDPAGLGWVVQRRIESES